MVGHTGCVGSEHDLVDAVVGIVEEIPEGLAFAAALTGPGSSEPIGSSAPGEV